MQVQAHNVISEALRSKQSLCIRYPTAQIWQAMN